LDFWDDPTKFIKYIHFEEKKYFWWRKFPLSFVLQLMNFTSFDHETLASPDMLKQQSYGQHHTYRQDSSSDFDFFSIVDNVMDPANMSHEQLQMAFSANHKAMSHLPQLTPDNTEGNRTSSSVLSGHNPDYATMSPLHMPTNPENADEYHTPLQTSATFHGHDDMNSMMDEEV
jgi:hypothetical protein